MLSKLLKYEIKATARTFLPLYAALIIFAVINQVISSLSTKEWSAPAVISMMLYVTILIGMVVMTYIVMIQRFYRNLLSDEGYLMFTLPTKPWMHIVSKLLVSMMWMVISGIAAFISILIIAMDKVDLGEMFRELPKAWAKAHEELGGSFYPIIAEMILFAVLSLAASILIIYASIAIGHLANRHKVLASFGAFLALNTIAQTLISFTSFIPLRYVIDIGPIPTASAAHMVIWIGIAFSALLTAGYFFTANIILSRKLNLE